MSYLKRHSLTKRLKFSTETNLSFYTTEGNRRVIVITSGEPIAHFHSEEGMLRQPQNGNCQKYKL